MQRKFLLKNFGTFFVPILIPVLIFSVLALNVFQKMLKDDIDISTYQTLSMSKERIELIFSDMNLNRILIDYNPQLSLTLMTILKGNEESYIDAMALRHIYPFLKANSYSRSYIHSIYIYLDSSDYFLVNGRKMLVSDYHDRIWYESYRQGRDRGLSLWTEKRQVYNQDVVSIYQRTKLNGLLVINLSQDYFNNILDSITTYNNQALFVLNENDELIFANDSGERLAPHIFAEYLQKSAARASMSEGDADPRVQTASLANTAKQAQAVSDTFKIDHYHVFEMPSEQYQFKYVSFIPDGIIYETPDLLMRSSVVSITVSVLVSFLLAYFFAQRNNRQIKNIVQIFERAEQGREIPDMVKKESDAYSLILNHVIKTFVNQSYIKLQLSERKYRQMSAELVALQYQINPHFLFNTLQSIHFEILNETGKPVYANYMIEQLSGMLRYSLDGPWRMVDIRDEIENTKRYIDIQKYRLENPFVIVWDVDEEVLECKTLRLMLQPIIENSFQHGLSKKEGDWKITIRIKRFGDDVRFEIADNGIGMTQERLERLIGTLDSEPDYEQSTHIGLRNIHARLKLKYGEDYGLEIVSSPDTGTSVRLKIKFLQDAPQLDSGSKLEETRIVTNDTFS